MKLNPIARLFIAFTLVSALGAHVIEARAALYCYPQGFNTVCFSDDGRSVTNERSRESVENPNLLIITPMAPMYPPPPRVRREVPEQDFGECTLALGCIKDRR